MRAVKRATREIDEMESRLGARFTRLEERLAEAEARKAAKEKAFT